MYHYWNGLYGFIQRSRRLQSPDWLLRSWVLPGLHLSDIHVYGAAPQETFIQC